MSGKDRSLTEGASPCRMGIRAVYPLPGATAFAGSPLSGLVRG